MFSVTAILIHDTLQTNFPLSDALINEAPWQCTSLQHDRLLQLISGVELPTVIDMHHGVIRLNAGDILTPQVRDRVSRNVLLPRCIAPSCCRVSGVARIFVWRGRFCTPNRCNGPCTYYTTPNAYIFYLFIMISYTSTYVLFDQYNGAYSKENFGLHTEVHMASASLHCTE